MRLCSLLLVIFACLFVVIEPIRAESLEELMQSPVLMYPDTADGDTNRLDDAKWFEGRPNLFKIFRSGEKPALLLLDWLGEVVSIDFSLSSKDVGRDQKIASLHLIYEAPEESRIRVDLLIPHPLHQEQVKLGLVTAFAKLEPPTLQVNSFERMVIRGNEAFLYEHKDGACSLLFKLTMEGRLNFFTDKCEHSAHLVNLAEQSDISRLKHKLEG
ncbi:MAG: hypothetical protein J5J00_13095 [Deltaproteobacteria bacterium]|nr:hypothetical protein [Deltaproteobacteria bacterium]